MRSKSIFGRLVVILMILFAVGAFSQRVFGQENTSPEVEVSEEILNIPIDEIILEDAKLNEEVARTPDSLSKDSEDLRGEIIERDGFLYAPVEDVTSNLEVTVPETEVVEEQEELREVYLDIDEIVEEDFIVFENGSGENSTENETFTPEINIQVVNVPSGTINSNSGLQFIFNLSYNGSNPVECELQVSKNGTLVYQDSENSLSLSWNLSSQGFGNGNYQWDLECSDGNVSDNETGSFQILYLIQVSFSSNKQNIVVGQQVIFYVNVTNAQSLPANYLLFFGDGGNSSGSSNEWNFNHTLTRTYTSAGSFGAVLTGLSGMPGINIPIQISVIVNVTNISDTEAPSVTLIEPEDEEDFDVDRINFTYRATDNVKVQNCTYNLYYYNTSSIGSLVYTKFKGDIIHNEEVLVELVDFDEGGYSWEVGCYDNSTNYREVSRDFDVDFDDGGSSSESQTQTLAATKKISDEFSDDSTSIQEVIDMVNDYLVLEEKLGKSEREALDSLGISEEMRLYKKRLIQMKSDLSNNFAYLTEDSRAKRIEEVRKDVEEMRSKVPVGFEVVESDEYLKNSFDFDLKEIAESYVLAKGISLDERGVEKLAEGNKEIQKSLSVNVRSWKVEIEYGDRSESLSLISKEVDASEDYDSLIEVVPEEVASSSEEVTFVNEARVLRSSGPIFEVLKDDLIEERIVYYVNDEIDLKDVEKSSTVLFREELPKSSISGVSGFVTFVGAGTDFGSVWFWVAWLSAFVFIGMTVSYSAKKYRIKRWKRSPDFKKISEIYKEIEKHLKNKEIAVARDKYNQIKELYTKIPENSRKFVFGKMKKIIKEIDKMDIREMVKELSTAVKEQRREDAIEVYNKIKSLYGRMDKRFKKKVYGKVSELIKELK